MELIALLKEEAFDIDVEKLDESRFLVKIWQDENKTSSRDYEVNLHEPQPNLYSMIHGQNSYEVRLVDKGEGKMDIQFYNEAYAINMTDPVQQLLEQATGAGAKGEAALESAMPGKVQRILVEVGDEVEADQGLVVLVAMKMENELTSPKAGVVKEILVKEGDNVDGGAPLIVVG